ncbi:MAG: hypothetical protein HQL56_02255 [Magnetococcales bacterium]|nr:hypothetical protein [Magnetococcales bacterium]
MRNILRGSVLGVLAGMAVTWQTQGISEFFPVAMATIILVGILLAMENLDHRMTVIQEGMGRIEKQLQSLDARLAETPAALPVVGLGVSQPPPANSEADEEEEDEDEEFEKTFIPGIAINAMPAKPISQRREMTGDSLEEVARKLAAMQKQ